MFQRELSTYEFANNLPISNTSKYSEKEWLPMCTRGVFIYEFVNDKLNQDDVFTIQKRGTKYTCSYSSGPIGSEIELPEQSISKKECDKMMDEYRLSKDWVELIPLMFSY